VLDSAYPPDVEVLTSQGDIAFAAFDGLAEACVADVGCATDHGDPREQLVAAASTLDAEPVTLDGRTFDGPALVREVTASLYDEYLLTELPAILATAAEDPAAGLEELGWWDDEPMLGWGPRRRSPVPAYAESDGTFFAVECREAVATADLTEARARAAALPAPFDRAAARDLDELTAVCDRVASGVASAQELAPAVSDVPTLLLAGGLDPVTPPAWATHAATTLDRATVVTFPALGHGVLYSGTCATGLATRFLDDPTAAPDDACTRAFGHVRFGR
jgi:pimeloyl-ACP methyl ester carboxylesterase